MQDPETNPASLNQSEPKIQPADYYKPLEPIKPFEPLKPFEPMKPFEPLKPFEPPKSFELALELEKKEYKPKENPITNNQEFENKEDELNKIKDQNDDGGGFLPVGYKPVEALEPWKPDIALNGTASNGFGGREAEIKEEKIKNTLKEIISDLDNYAEKDDDLLRREDERTSSSYEKNTERREVRSKKDSL